MNALAAVWSAVLPLFTPLAVLTIGWKARGFLDKVVNNHLAHAKQDIIDAIKAGIVVEDEGHRMIVDSVRAGSDRIIDTLVTLHRD